MVETTKQKVFKVITAEEFLPELREKNPGAKWKEAVEHVYKLYGPIDKIQVINRKGESKFIVEVK